MFFKGAAHQFRLLYTGWWYSPSQTLTCSASFFNQSSSRARLLHPRAPNLFRSSWTSFTISFSVQHDLLCHLVFHKITPSDIYLLALFVHTLAILTFQPYLTYCSTFGYLHITHLIDYSLIESKYPKIRSHDIHII